ncbi:MAG: hypothetical protein FJY76_02520 [Candidatus Aenigmarchaeota archaeon]|nr:hypothetical protein [Candidatus Aenigmarchaeota archaeon]
MIAFKDTLTHDYAITRVDKKTADAILMYLTERGIHVITHEYCSHCESLNLMTAEPLDNIEMDIFLGFGGEVWG